MLIVCEISVAAATESVQFVGRDVCKNCHTKETAQWQGSHHDLAMQPATRKTVRGNFDNASVTQFGVTSSFYIQDSKFMVRTEGPDGTLENYVIKFTFGVEPLQQYLIEFPGGRLQALSLAWDTRPKKQGGQRWFHLYPDEKISHDDELHWTQPSHNWNSMCAECHSTHLEKNYAPLNKTFDTHWSEIDVSCEACHGPGADHVAWAKRKPGWKNHKTNKGLAVLLDERKDVHWKINPKTGNASRSKVRNGDKEIEVCARCHSRRSPISGDYVHGKPLLDQYLPRLLDEGMYYVDGQIDNEVYVYGSFLQSKMYQAGVTCSDCHEPHSLSLRKPGNGVCLQCHQATKYEKSTHHFHQPDSQGASCIECHMPAKTYMVVDPRHDHSMRIPRPDVSVRLGTPNACNSCHDNKSPEWAAKQVKTWYGHTSAGFQLYAQVFHTARQGEPGAGDALAALIRDMATPDIARATALARIGPFLRAKNLDVLTLGLAHDDPGTREATVRALEFTPPEILVRLAFPMLDDPVRAVRISAARVLAAFPVGELPLDQRALLETGLQEYIVAQNAMAERPEAQTNLGNLYTARREFDKAVSAYKTAIVLNPVFAPAYVNLADLYRLQGKEAKTEKILRRAIKVIPRSADLHNALGLSLIRQKRAVEAVKALRLAASLNPDNERYAYIYAVALNSTAKSQQAVMVLQTAHNLHPNNTDILNALVAFHRDLGNQTTARLYAEKLRAVSQSLNFNIKSNGF